MKIHRLLLASILALTAFNAQAETQRARYGVAETFSFELFNADGTNDVDEADGGTEVSLSCDEGNETTATNDFVDEGTTYSIALTAAELKCERVRVIIAATVTNTFLIQTSALDNGVVTFGTAQSATGTTIVLAASTSYADDVLNCDTIAITGGTGAGQTRSITDWVSSSDTATVPTWTTNPDNTSVYEVYHTACATGSVSIATGGITNTSFASGAVDAAALNADAATEIGTATWATAARTLTAFDEDNMTIDLNATTFGTVTTLTNLPAITANWLTANGINSDAFTAAKFASDVAAEFAATQLAAQGGLTGTCDSGSTTTCVDDALTQANASQLQDRLICFDDSWCGMITTFTPGSDQVTTTKVAPSTRASKVYTIFPSTAL